jgi:hypothetical protein
LPGCDRELLARRGGTGLGRGQQRRGRRGQFRIRWQLRIERWQLGLVLGKRLRIEQRQLGRLRIGIEQRLRVEWR